MARRRSRATTEILGEIVGRLGLVRRAGDLDGLRRLLDLPERDGEVEDAAVIEAVRAIEARRAFAKDGVVALAAALPGLKGLAAPDGSLAWSLAVPIALLDDGRMDLRIDVAVEPAAAEILAGMARRNDATWNLPALRDATDATRIAVTASLRGATAHLREQIRADLAQVGADAIAYVEHMDRSLRSRRLTYDRTLAAGLAGLLKPVRSRARVVAGEGSRRRRLRDRVGFGGYIDTFAAARRLGRRIVFHMGPTNSGKTYAALEMLTKASTGAYLAPLRLLALENYETLAERGLRAAMITGEEVLGESDPTHTSRTIETADLRRPIEVAVIDEIQMIMDPDRGWAWTNALFGSPAKTVVVCGSEDALSYVRRAAEAADESLDVVTFTRKTPLLLMDEPVPLASVAPGDAVVAFSRRAVHQNREALIAAGHRVATIYGALSPEVRRAEAARFRAGEADVLVTTDAVGMGLNLGPLKRVLFSAVRKWDGVAERALTNSEIRQVAGRAGRFGHQEVGYVAAVEPGGIAPIRAALDGVLGAPAADTRFYLRPDRLAIDAMAAQMRTDSLHAVMARFAEATFYDGSPFQPSAFTDILEAAARADRFALTLDDKFAFTVCPIDRRDAVSLSVLDRWMEACAAGTGIPALRPGRGGDLAEQERLVRLSGAYLWLSRRRPAVFTEVEATRLVRTRANAAIEAYLAGMG